MSDSQSNQNKKHPFFLKGKYYYFLKYDENGEIREESMIKSQSNSNASLYDNNIERFHFEYEQKKLWIKKIIERNVEDMKGFIKESKRFKRAENANKENQYRILSFPWCIAGKLLSTLKFLN